VNLPIAAFLGNRTTPENSLVANPFDLKALIVDGVSMSGDCRPRPRDLVRTGMEKYTSRLHSMFFKPDQIEKQYTLWVVGTLATILGIWVIAGIGLMSSVSAISLAVIASSPAGLVSAPLYDGLLVLLLVGFVGVLFLVHRARTPEPGDHESGFAGFAWEPLDDGDQYPRIGGGVNGRTDKDR
jgi:hypothetical protein